MMHAGSANPLLQLRDCRGLVHYGIGLTARIVRSETSMNHWWSVDNASCHTSKNHIAILAITWNMFPYSSGLYHWHWGNCLVIAQMPTGYHRNIWVTGTGTTSQNCCQIYRIVFMWSILERKRVCEFEIRVYLKTCSNIYQHILQYIIYVPITVTS